MYIIIIPAAALVAAFIVAGFRVMRPTHRGVVETFGLYTRFLKPGLHWIVPGMQKIQAVSVTEQTLNMDPQLVTTKENLGVIADAQIYIRVKTDRDSVKAALYHTDNCIDQTVGLARTTLRDILATMPLRQAGIDREQIGTQICLALNAVTEDWGVEVVRCQLKEIEMPKDVQEIMHKLVIAENEKLAASDFAAAAELNADGLRRAAIKKAEGDKQARILAAEAEAAAMRIISDAARQHYTGNAQLYRVLLAAETTLKNNTKVIIENASGLLDKLCACGETDAAPQADDTKSDEPERSAQYALTYGT